MCNPNYLRDAIDVVLSMELPEHLLPFAIADQANLLAGFDCESGYDAEWMLAPESIVTFNQ